MFEQFYVGQRVFYTGRTSYNYSGDNSKGVVNEPGTIYLIGNSITILLDNYRKPYFTQSHLVELDNIYTIPQKHYANVSIGDLESGAKKVIPMT